MAIITAQQINNKPATICFSFNLLVFLKFKNEIANKQQLQV
jgi:hypothetical protein